MRADAFMPRAMTQNSSRSTASSGKVTNVWPIAGPPDVTFFNPVTGNVHVAIGEPGLVETINPVTGMRKQTVTGADAHTTVLVPPDRLYVISPAAWRRSRACGLLKSSIRENTHDQGFLLFQDNRCGRHVDTRMHRRTGICGRRHQHDPD